MASNVASVTPQQGCCEAAASVWTVTNSLGLVTLALAFVALRWGGLTWWKVKLLVSAAPASIPSSEIPEALALQDAYRTARGGCVTVRRGQLLLTRLDLIHRVCHDYKLFPNRGLPKNERANPLSSHLFSLEDERWRTVREVMSPAFTAAKLKTAFPLHATLQLQDTINAAIGIRAFADLDFKQLMERFVTDDVGRTLFGVECGALERPGNPFHAHCAQAFNNSVWRRLRQRLLDWWPSLAVRIPYRSSTASFFQAIVDRLRIDRGSDDLPHSDLLEAMFVAEKEAGGDAARGRMLRSVEAPQMFATFRAGFEATAPTLTFALLELAHNQEVQRRLQQELDDSTSMGGEADASLLTAGSLANMEYLDCVVKETLRKYPPNATLIRHAGTRCTLPGTELDPSGSNGVIVEEGTRLVVPVYAVHHDPALFPDPERFDPERFLPVERGGSCGANGAATAASKAYLPFGLGRRHCVARRFALQQVKVGLAAVLQRFDVTPCNATPSLPPPFLAGRSIVLAIRDDCPLRVTPRTQRNRPLDNS